VPELRIVEVDPQGPDASGLLREAAIEARSLYPELFDEDSAWPTNGPTLPGGFYLLAYQDQKAVVSGALRPLEGKVAEVRRMFVTPSVRRLGFARKILIDLEARAQRAGYETLRLETGYKQIPAIKLYESLGYVRIEAFGEYVGDPTSVCFEKSIKPRLSDA
jgi:GNAT superfamily N-acetyltransferase